MNAKLRRLIPIALILLLVGVLIMAAAMFSMKFDFSRLGTRKAVTNTYAPAGDFEDIIISVDTADVVFLPSEDGKLKVVCVEEEGCRHIVSTLTGKLSIQSVDSREWYELIGVNSVRTSVTVYLPKKEYGALTLRTDTGDVSVPGSFRFDSIMMIGSTVDITVGSSVGGRLSIGTSTGSITVSGVQAASLDLSASSGHISVGDSVISGPVEVHTSTGKISFANLNFTEGSVRTSTGDISLDSVLASGSLRVRTGTGDVGFARSDAPDIDVETDTGDVTGTLLTAKEFSYETNTGKAQLPASGPGGRCRLKSDTGDFELSIAG